MGKIKKKYIVFGCIVAVLAGLFFAARFVVPLFIDHEDLRKKAETRLTEVLGYEVKIRQSDVEFTWYPTVTLSNVIVKNHPQGTSDKLMAARSIIIDYHLLSMFGESMEPASVLVDAAVIEIETVNEDGKLNLIPDKKIVSNDLSHGFADTSVTFQNSRVNYTPYRGKAVYKYEDVDVTLAHESGTFTVNGGFYAGKKRFQIDLSSSMISGDFSQDIAMNLNAQLSLGNQLVAYEGTIASEKGKFSGTGTMDVLLINPADWIYFFDLAGLREGLYAAFDSDLYPAKGTFAISVKNDVFSVSSEDFNYNNSPIKFKTKVQLGDTDKFALSFYTPKLLIPDVDDTAYTPDALNELMVKFLPKNAAGKLSVRADKISYNDVEAANIKIDATLLDGEFVINQSTMDMAGDTQILLFGIFKRDINDNANLDGNIEILGKDVQAFFSAINMDEHKLLANHSGEFRSRANLYLSAAVSHVSEFRFQAGTFLVEGGLEYNADEKVNYESSLRVRGGTLDSLAKYINPTTNKALLDSDYKVPKLTLPWLDSMKNTYAVTLLFEDFTLFDLPGKRSRFIVNVKPEEMAFRSVDLNVGDIRFRGDVSINQEDVLPFIDADFYLSDFNIDSLLGSKFRSHPVKRGNILSVWDDGPLNVDFLKGYNGKFNMRFGAMHHPSFVMKDVLLDAVVDDSTWEIDAFNGSVWNGTIESKGTLDVSSIASAKLEFQMKNIFLHEFLSSMLNINAIRGKMNINGRVDTAGVTAHNLIDNMSANIVLVGNNIVIKGFDMAGLIQALPNVRSNSDVANTTRVALIGGQTTFRTVEGAFFVDDAKLQTHGLTLRSKHAIGKMVGSADLLSWIMNYAIKFRLPTVSQSTFPSLTMYFRDSMDDPLLQVDTRELESFMTQRKLNR